MDILMYDCSIKGVKDLKSGDKIMGALGQCLTVSDCALQSGPRYLLKYYEGECEVGPEQLLSLIAIKDTRDFLDREVKAQSTCVISVRDFLRSSDDFKKSVVIWRSALDFKERKVIIEPYEFGVLLGYDAFVEKVNSLGVMNSLSLTAPGYIKNSRDIRMHLLAGVLDVDGVFSDKEFTYCTKREGLAEQIALLARSLGFVMKMEKETIDGGDIYIVHGMCSKADKARIAEIPLSFHDVKEADNLHEDMGRFELMPLDEGEYVTFTVEGNVKQFLRSDFTVGYAGVAEEGA